MTVLLLEVIGRPSPRKARVGRIGTETLVVDRCTCAACIPAVETQHNRFSHPSGEQRENVIHMHVREFFFFFFFCTYVQFFRFCDHGISRRVEKYFFSFEHSKGKIAYRPRIWSLRLIYDWYTGRSKCSFAAVKVYQGQ